MKAFTISMLMAGLVVSSKAYPGIYRISRGYSGIQVSDTHIRGYNAASNSDNVVNSTGISVQSTIVTKIVVRGIDNHESAGSSTTASLTESIHDLVDAVHVAESADISTRLGEISEFTHESIHFIDVADSTLDSINNIARDSTHGSVRVDSTRGSLIKDSGSTRGVIDGVKPPRVPAL